MADENYETDLTFDASDAHVLNRLPRLKSPPGKMAVFASESTPPLRETSQVRLTSHTAWAQTRCRYSLPARACGATGNRESPKAMPHGFVSDAGNCYSDPW